MSKTLVANGPKKFTSGDLTLFEIRVLGVFVAAFLDIATALGVEADAVRNLIVQEIFENEHSSEPLLDDGDRLFEASWTDPNGSVHTRYAGLFSNAWTEVFDTVEDINVSALRL